MPNCPVCAEKSVLGAGSKDSPILIIGESPGESEIRYGKPLTGPTGKIFRKEWMKIIEQDLWMFRVCNLWIHTPNKSEDCLCVGHDLAIEEAEGKIIVILIGAETVSHFTGYNVSDVSGLTVPCEAFGKAVTFCMVKPETLFHKGVGELRFALKQLRIELDRLGVL